MSANRARAWSVTAHITVRFGGLAAVDDLSLELGRGEILALIGPNGAGKSTAFNVVTGFQSADAGRVRFGAADITGEPPYRIAERGLVRMFQRTSIFPESSALDNVLTACHGLARTGLFGVLCMSRASRPRERGQIERAREILAFVGLGTRKVRPRECSRAASSGWGLAIALAPAPSVLLLGPPQGSTRSRRCSSWACRANQRARPVRAAGRSTTWKLVMGPCDRVVAPCSARRQDRQGTPGGSSATPR